MAIKFLSISSKTLASSITSSASSLQLSDIKGWDGTDLVAGDFGDTIYAVLRNSTNSVMELMELDPTTIASASITITRRGLQFDGDLTTEVSANKRSWVKGDTIVDIGAATPQVFEWLKQYIDAASIAGAVPMTPSVQGIAKLSTAAASASDPIVVGDNDARLPTTDENNALAGTPGTPSSSNKFVTQAKSVTAGATINGATLPIPVYQNKTDNEFYACDANDTAAMKFLGFAISNGTDGNAMNVQFNGIVPGFTGLSEGEKYYVQDAVGTIGTTIGTYEVLVGIAISETELLIQKGRRRASGSDTLTNATGSSAIVAGFRPSVVRIYAAVGGTTYGSTMAATWSNGTITGVGMIYNEGSEGVGVNAPRVYTGSSSTFHTFSITSVTDTGFTITWTETGSMDAGTFHWEAEGEL